MTGEQADLGGTLDASAEVKGSRVAGGRFGEHLTGNVAFAATNLNYPPPWTPLMRTLVESLSTALGLPSISGITDPADRHPRHGGQGRGESSLRRWWKRGLPGGRPGDIRLADVLTNSTPSVAGDGASSQSDGGWDELPSFLTFKGTLGVPKPVLDPLALARTMTRLPAPPVSSTPWRGKSSGARWIASSAANRKPTPPEREPA